MRRGITRTLAISSAVAVALALAGCSGGGSNGTSAADAKTATGTLRVLIPAYPSSSAGTQDFAKVVADFHKTWPKMTVQPDYATYANLNEKLSTSIAGGTPYDVMVTGVGWIQPFAAKGVYQDLSTYGVTPSSLGKTDVPAVLPGVTYNGKIYAVPLTADTRAIGYRKSDLKKAGLDPSNPPTSFAAIKAAAEKLTQRDASGAITRPGFDFNAGPGMYRQDFIWLLASTGTPLYKDGRPNFDNAKGVEVLNWMKSMVGHVQRFGQQNAAQKPMTYTGQAPMGFVGGSIDCTSAGIGSKNCDDLTFALPDNGKKAEFMGGNLASIGAASKNKDAAWAFIKALTSPSAINDQALLNNQIPSQSSATPQNSSALGNPLSRFVSENLSSAINEGGPTNWLDVRNNFNSDVDNVLLGKADPATVLKQLAAQSQ